MPIETKRSSGVGIIYNGLILLAERAREVNGIPCAMGGYWSIFAGAIEEGEDPMSCAVRELYEESEIKIGIENLVYAGEIQGDSPMSILHIYFSHFNHMPTPILNCEHTSYGWFSIKDIDAFPDPIDENIVDLLKIHFEKHKQRGIA